MIISPIPSFRLLASLLIGWVVASPSARSAETAYTSAIGIYTLKVPGKPADQAQSRTYFGLQLLPDMIVSGEAGTITGDAFSYDYGGSYSSMSDPTRTSYIHITTGTGRGRVIDIAEFRANDVRCTENLSGILHARDRVNIRRHSTLADIFGVTNRFNFAAGTDAASADNVVAWDPATQKERVYYYHSTRARWEEKNINASAANAVMRYPYGLYIIRRSSGTVRIALSGEIASYPVMLPVRTGPNVLSLPLNLSASLDQLITSQGNFPVQSGKNAGQADLLTFEEPTTGTRRGPYYFSSRPNAGGWREVGAGGGNSPVTLDLLSTLVIHRPGPPGFVLAEANLNPGPGFPPLPPDPEAGEVPLDGEMVVPHIVPNGFEVFIETSTDLQVWATAARVPNSGGKVVFPLPAGQTRAFYRLRVSL